jgi:putative tricarboxylic transport membrane protein
LLSKGLASPEAGNNAAAGGALATMLTLRVPASDTTAVLPAVLATLSITPYPMLFVKEKRGHLGPYRIAAHCQLCAVCDERADGQSFVKILEVPPAALMHTVTMILMVDIFFLTSIYFDLILIVSFSVLGYVLRKVDIPTVSVILGILLGGKMKKTSRHHGAGRWQRMEPHLYPSQ